MATPTYDLLDSVTLASSASSVTFSSIDQSYGDLIFVFEGTGSSTGYSTLQVNGDTASNYSQVEMRGNGSSASSLAFTANTLINRPVFISGNRVMLTSQLMDYSATDKHKTVLSRGGTENTETVAIAARWANTAAITSITMNFSNFAAGSTFYLYGIAKAL